MQRGQECLQPAQLVSDGAGREPKPSVSKGTTESLGVEIGRGESKEMKI